MQDDGVRAALLRHWAAADADDFAAEHAIDAEDAVLEYPQSRERLRGPQRIQASRGAQPGAKRFAVRRLLGGGGGGGCGPASSCPPAAAGPSMS